MTQLQLSTCQHFQEWCSWQKKFIDKRHIYRSENRKVHLQLKYAFQLSSRLWLLQRSLSRVEVLPCWQLCILCFQVSKNSCLCKLDPFDVEVAPFAEHILLSGGIMLEACRNLMLAGVFHGFLKMDWGISKPRLGLSQSLFKKGWHDILESSIEPRFRISGSSKPSCFCNPHPLITGHCHHMTDSICKLRAGRGQKSSLLAIFIDHYIQLWACRVMSCKKNCS